MALISPFVTTTIEDRPFGGYQDGPSIVVSVKVEDLMGLPSGHPCIEAGWVERWPAPSDDRDWTEQVEADDLISDDDIFAVMTGAGDLYSTHATEREAIVALTAVLTLDATKRLNRQD